MASCAAESGDETTAPTWCARSCAAAIAIVAAYSLARTFYDYSYGLDALSNGLAQTTLYYTHWANAFVVIVFGAVGLRIGGFRQSRAIGHTIVILAILLAHYWILRGIGDFLHSPLRSKIIHGALPLAIGFYWFAFVNKRDLHKWDPFRWTAPPIAYTVCALVRGEITGEYAYDVGDPGLVGYPFVFGLIGATTLFALLVGYLLLWVDRSVPERWNAGFLRRRSRPRDAGWGT